MNNEQLFRQALQRQNDRAARLKMPDDMEQRVMQRVKSKKAIRRWLYPISIAAAAASVLLLLTLHYSEGPTSLEAVADLRQGVPTPGKAPADLRERVPAPRKAPADSREGVPAPGKALADSRERVPAPGKALADSRKGVPTPGKALADSREGVPTSVEAVQTEHAQQTNRAQPAEPATEVLTERDIPITRPENYKYTPEEIALLKRQAAEAYLKWVELELEIAKHSQEQTAQQY